MTIDKILKALQRSDTSDALLGVQAILALDQQITALKNQIKEMLDECSSEDPCGGKGKL